MQSVPVPNPSAVNKDMLTSSPKKSTADESSTPLTIKKPIPVGNNTKHIYVSNFSVKN